VLVDAVLAEEGLVIEEEERDTRLARLISFAYRSVKQISPLGVSKAIPTGLIRALETIVSTDEPNRTIRKGLCVCSACSRFTGSIPLQKSAWYGGADGTRTRNVRS
jgi:hypothetical protein